MVTEFKDLVDCTIAKIENNEEELRIIMTDGTIVELYHEQDCCEHVAIESIDGELQDLVGEKIVVATEQEFAGVDLPDHPWPEDRYKDSWTWHVYTLQAGRKVVVIRWLGVSNGYYSEDVNMRVTSVEEVEAKEREKEERRRKKEERERNHVEEPLLPPNMEF